MTAHTTPRPMIDTWYKSGQGDMFEVVAVDEQEDAIGIQYLDGSVEELDGDAWSSLELEVIDPPREALGDDYDEGEKDFAEGADPDEHGAWSGGFDDLE